MSKRTWGIGRNGNVRERTRGVVILVVAFIGLVAEGISTIQDGIGGPKVIALACFAFLFWYGWELAHRAGPKARGPQ
jgi:threonine/homoserine/homoserine lactone efflux protein